MREAEWQAKEKARKEAKEKTRLEAKEAKAREAVARQQREEKEKARRQQEADAALRKAVEAAGASGAHEPLKAEIQRRQDALTLPFHTLCALCTLRTSRTSRTSAPSPEPPSLTSDPCCGGRTTQVPSPRRLPTRAPCATRWRRWRGKRRRSAAAPTLRSGARPRRCLPSRLLCPRPLKCRCRCGEAGGGGLGRMWSGTG